MTAVTVLNPAGVRRFDHTRIAAVPAYRAAGLALRELVLALQDARTGMTQEQLLEAVRDLTATAGMFDDCPECLEQLMPPVQVRLGDGGVLCLYRCLGCEHIWMCSWSPTAAPIYLDGPMGEVES